MIKLHHYKERGWDCWPN